RSSQHRALHSFPTRRSSDLEGPPLILLTPEQATFQMEQALLSTAAVRATHRAHVLSFRRLAARVLQETGLGARPPLGELGKRMVDRKSTRLNSSHVKSSYAV